MLTLPIKKQWFDMILSGEKKEEYRDVKPYYLARFHGKEKRKIRLRNGYGKTCPSLVATVTLSIGTGRPEWGAVPGRYYFVLRIHDVKLEGAGDS